MMKLFYHIILAITLLVADAYAKTPKFIEGLEDIPLMNGLSQLDNEIVTFGNEESRFVEVSLTTTKAGFKKVEQFYKTSLPQLGWIYQGTVDDTVVFYRDSESLSIHKENSNPLKIRITVKNRD